MEERSTGEHCGESGISTGGRTEAADSNKAQRLAREQILMAEFPDLDLNLSPIENQSRICGKGVGKGSKY